MNNKEDKCSCNKSYEKAKRIIDEANKNIKYRYIQGPKEDKEDIDSTGSSHTNWNYFLCWKTFS